MKARPLTDLVTRVCGKALSRLVNYYQCDFRIFSSEDEREESVTITIVREKAFGRRMLKCKRCGWEWLSKALPDSHGYVCCPRCKRKQRLNELQR